MRPLSPLRAQGTSRVTNHRRRCSTPLTCKRHLQIVPSENPDCKTCTQEVQECLMLADRVSVTDRSSGRTTATIAPLANFLHAGGRMSALAAAPHQTAMLVISGSQQGLVSCVPFELPQAAGSAVEEIQVRAYCIGNMIDESDSAVGGVL